MAGHQPKARAALNPAVVVVGGAVLDVVAYGNKSLLPSTSNPGVIKMQVGGVGRNISEALVHLDVPTLLIAPVGPDPAALTIRQWCQTNHMATDGLVEISSARTPVYSALMHETGELLYGMCAIGSIGADRSGVIDSAIFDEFTVQHAFRSQISGAKWAVLDSNLSRPMLREAVQMCKQLKVPVFFEPVSVQKAQNVAECEILREISILCPNVRELLSICYKMEAAPTGTLEEYLEEGLKKTHVLDYTEHVKRLLDAGVQQAVIVKLGPRGVLVGTHSGAHSVNFESFPALKADVVNVLGAGDCLVAGILYGLIHGNSVAHAVRHGLVAAKLSVESPVPVPPTLTLERLRELYAEWLSLPRIAC